MAASITVDLVLKLLGMPTGTLPVQPPTLGASLAAGGPISNVQYPLSLQVGETPIPIPLQATFVLIILPPTNTNPVELRKTTGLVGINLLENGWSFLAVNASIYRSVILSVTVLTPGVFVGFF